MNFLAHIIGGFITVTLFLFLTGQFFLSLPQILLLIFAYIIGIISSDLPDIDSRTSIIFKALNTIIFLILLGSSILYLGLGNNNWLLAFLAPILIFAIWYFFLSRLLIPSHRGFIHSWIFGTAWGLLIFFGSGGNLILTGASIVGFLTHLGLDGELFKVL